jgi:carbon monoxide dehydrogenase subunit G
MGGYAMSMVQQAIEVGAPLHTVYEQLSTFENYPQFMHGVEKVTRVGDNQTHWVMDLDGHRREFDATITERSLDERVSWSTVDGPLVAETLTLRPLGETRTQVVAQLEADIAFLLPSGRHGSETLTRRLKSDLDTFKNLCEGGKFGSGAGFAAGSGSGAGFAASFSSGTGSGPGVGSKQLFGRSSTIFGSGPLRDPASVAARPRTGPTKAKPGAGWSTSGGTNGANPEFGSGGTGTAEPGDADLGLSVDSTSAPGVNDDHDLDDFLTLDRLAGGPGSTRSARGATAPMGGQAMSAKDTWGDGMINEEDRGSSHDL